MLSPFLTVRIAHHVYRFAECVQTQLNLTALPLRRVVLASATANSGNRQPWGVDMVKQLTHYDTRTLPDVVKIGEDLVLFPKILSHAGNYANYIDWHMRYDAERSGNAEPAWIHALPRDVIADLRGDYVRRHADPIAIVNKFSYTGI